MESFRPSLSANPVRQAIRALSFALLALLAPSAVSAQTATGGVRGFIKDDTGAVLVGVTVEAVSPSRIGGAAVDVTNAQGLYQFENLPVGQYSITFTLQGFSSVKREDIRVEVGRTVQADAQLAVGNVEQSITVSGESPVVDALHAGVQTNFNADLLANIPTARQSYFDVITFAPSVRINAVPNDSRFVIMGSSSDQNSFQYDGVDISAVSNGGVWDFPSPDIMQEVRSEDDGRVVRVLQLSGWRRQHRHQIGQQHPARLLERIQHSARHGRQQYAGGAVPLQRAFQLSDDL
jgi:hypothetical protein